MLCIGTKFISTPSKPMRYNARHCERTLLYQTLAEHYETWLVFACAVQFDGQVDHYSPKPYRFGPVKFSTPKDLVGRRSKTPTLVEQTPLLVS
ncbi:hypothetical protein H663_014365 [Limnohabitans planktonicus II-D5]|uniref:Uncharacterized protein n=1 Tax=Limnohabitans planktonicus II-D5 TaxID=1293045 RepID=A0A2T7UB38_9BURK|nr:hypothetical protein H663_014365 [Limnohabitans planktonicus II-D5]